MTTKAGVNKVQENDNQTSTPDVQSPKGVMLRGDNDDRKVFVKGGDATSRVHFKPSQAPQFQDEQDTIMLSPSTHTSIKAQRSFLFRMAQTFGIFGSIVWAALCTVYLVVEGGLGTQTPYELGIFVAGILAPIAFYWMLLSYLQRNNDVQYYAESMRAELHTLFFPSEEDSKHVNKDIERMTLQAAELAASSKAALKAIQRTRQGLRHEISEFATLARKAETHLLSLSDNLVERTGTVGDLVETLENRIDVIDQKSQKSITSWDEASVRMVERASDIEASMDKGASSILSMAEAAEDKSKAVSEMFDGTITSLDLTVDAVVDRLAGMNDNFGSYTRTLQVSTEELSKETSRLGAMIEDQVDQLKDTAGQSVEMISQSLVEMSDQKSLLEESSNILTTQVSGVMSSMGATIDDLTQATETIIEKADDTELRLSDKSSKIAATLDGFTGQIDRIDELSDVASHRLNEGIEAAVNGASQVSEAVRRGVETLSRTSKDAIGEADSLIETTVSHVQQLKEVGQGNVSSVETMTALLEQSRLQIERSASSAQTHVEMLNKSVDSQGDKLEASALSLADQVKNVTHALEEPMRMVGIAIADADGRHVQIQETLERRVNDLREASTKASETVEGIRQSLREQTQDISSLSGRVLSQSKTLNQELAENKVQLGDTIDTTLIDMNRLIDGFKTTNTTIHNASSAMIHDVSNATEVLETSANRLQDTSSFTLQALSQSGDAFVTQSSIIDKTVENAGRLIDESTDKLVYASEKITPLYDRVESGSNKAYSALNEFKEAYEDVADTTMTKIDDASLQFDDRLLKLQSGSEEASTLLKNVSEVLHQRLDDIDMAATSSSEKMRTLSSSMEGQSSDIHILTDQVSLKIDTIQKLIGEQFRELSESVGQAVGQIEEAGDAFDTRSDKIAESAQLITDRFVTAGDEAAAKAYELKQASKNVAEISGQSVAQISAQMDVLEEKSDGSLSNLRKTSDTLSIKSREIDAMMQSVISQVKSYAVDMKEQVNGVAEQSDVSANRIGQSIEQLLGTMDNVNGKTKSVVSFINETNQSLYDQSGRFITAVSKSAQAVEHATELFSSQTDNMLKASRVAVDKTKELQDNELRVGRETFLSSARFVLESLHSLSIDFVRMIDGEIDEKEWKSYQKGDVAIFTSKMVERLDDMPADKIRDKYADDTEFRNYVQKFMRQFEDVLNQTNTVDHGAVLGTTFAASDVGKIYRYLCNVTGRNTKKVA